MCPGWVATPLRLGMGDPEVARRILQTVPLRKIARPHDVAMACVYLASSHLAGHVSGEVVTVSGGMEGRVLYTPGEVDPTLFS